MTTALIVLAILLPWTLVLGILVWAWRRTHRKPPAMAAVTPPALRPLTDEEVATERDRMKQRLGQQYGPVFTQLPAGTQAEILARLASEARQAIRA